MTIGGTNQSFIASPRLSRPVGKSPRTPYETGLSFEPWFSGLIETCQRLGQARDAAPRPCQSCRRCRRLSTPATAPASSPCCFASSLLPTRRTAGVPITLPVSSRWEMVATSPSLLASIFRRTDTPTSCKSARSKRVPVLGYPQGLPIPNEIPP